MSKKKKEIVLDKIDECEALAILRILAKDKELAGKIEEIATERLSEVDIEDVAHDVFSDLDGIDVEDVWKNSGGTRYGYVDPNELAWEMFEEALEPFVKKLKDYEELSMQAEAKRYCMGILKGIHQFDKESSSEYSDWVEDAPGESFEEILGDWKKRCKNKKDIKEMDSFVKENFPEW